MPYKERVKLGLASKREKPKYKVINWTQYNQSLRKRGMIANNGIRLRNDRMVIITCDRISPR